MDFFNPWPELPLHVTSHGVGNLGIWELNPRRDEPLQLRFIPLREHTMTFMNVSTLSSGPD
jgi:hypothetical protein